MESLFHIFEKFQRDLIHTQRFNFAIMNHNDSLDNARINSKGYLLVILMLRLVEVYMNLMRIEIE